MPKLTSHRVAAGAAPGTPFGAEMLHPTTFRFTADERDLLATISEVMGWTKALAIREALATLADKVGIPIPPDLQDRRPAPPSTVSPARAASPAIGSGGIAPHRRGPRGPNAPRAATPGSASAERPDAEDTGTGAFAARCEEARTARQYRERRPVTYDVIAAEVSAGLGRAVSRSTAFRWMKGEQECGMAERQVLAQVLGVSPVWLTFGEV